jgi:DNA-3-methyladenine glycosylase I
MKNRCGWCGTDPLYIAYHDEEWGTPIHDDRKLFEFLILESAQAGLSWITVLRKRENYRQAFDHFDPDKVSRYDSQKITELMADQGIIRNRRKIEAAIQNAKVFLKIQDEFGSFATYAWQFVGGRPKSNRWSSLEEVPAVSPESNAMSKDMQKRGFKFCGPTICYAYMQATGMVNDHLVDCFKYNVLCGFD